MTDKKKRIYWDTCVFIYLLSKFSDREKIKRQEVCKYCFQNAIDGKVDIFVSTLNMVEVNKTEESATPLSSDIKDKIKNVFEQPFIQVISADLARAEEARELIWKYTWLKPVDAIHLASALHAKVDELFTYDGKGGKKGLLDIDGLEGNPHLTICHPHFEAIQTEMAE